MGRLKTSLVRSPGFSTLPLARTSWLTPKVLLAAMSSPPEFTTIWVSEPEALPGVLKLVEAAFTTPPLLTTSCVVANCAAGNDTESPEPKVSVPPSVNVWAAPI